MKLFQLNVPGNKREISWILSNIAAGSHRQIDLLFETNDIVETLIEAFDCEDHRVRKVLFAFLYSIFPLFRRFHFNFRK